MCGDINCEFNYPVIFEDININSINDKKNMMHLYSAHYACVQRKSIKHRLITKIFKQFELSMIKQIHIDDLDQYIEIYFDWICVKLITNGSTEILDYLISLNLSINIIKHIILVAIKYNKIEYIKKYCKYIKNDPINDYIEQAIEMNNLEIIKILHEYGCPIINFHINKAINNLNFSIAEYLYAKGARSSDEYINMMTLLYDG
jgi:hypothetical protein